MKHIWWRENWGKDTTWKTLSYTGL